MPLVWDDEIQDFRWTVAPSRRLAKGSRAGCFDPTNGYRKIKYKETLHYTHRLAYVWHTGHTLYQCIDHINGDKLDNRRENLRQTTHQINMQNKKRYVTNTSGVTGVRHIGIERPRPWEARISRNGGPVIIGLFATKSEAVRARRGAELDSGFHTNHGRTQEIVTPCVV